MLTSKQQKVLQSLGVMLWQHRSQNNAQTVFNSTEIKENNQDWQSLEQKVLHCKTCPLHMGRTNTVFGSGNQQADLMIIGEGPGQDEDKQGLPFVGRAGQLLTKMLFAIKLDRKEVYIANVVKCRPPNNRNPHLEEALKCLPYLQQQIALVKPKIILLLGKIAATYVLDTSESMWELRGEIHEYRLESTVIPVMVTYHPAYLLRTPADKFKVWSDLVAIKEKLK